MGYSILNNVAVQELASKILFENIVQDILVIPFKGADLKYTSDGANAKAVDIQRTKMVNDGRVLGATTNGDFYDSSYGALQSQIFTLNLDIVASRPIKIPKVADDMNGGLLLKSVLRNIPKQISRVVNCGYLSTVLTSALNYAISATSANNTVTYAFGSDNYTAMAAATAAGAMDAFDKAFANLGYGDQSNGFDIFPTEDSQLFATPSYLMSLKNNAGLFTNSNIGQEMVTSGSFTAFDSTYVPQAITGYWGELAGVTITNVGSLFTTVEGWLGQLTLADSTQAGVAANSLQHLCGVLVCGSAVAGGMYLDDQVKVIDSVGGQGWEAQPLARCGFTAFSPKGIQIIADTTGLTASNFVTYTGSGSAATQTKKLSVYAPLNR